MLTPRVLGFDPKYPKRMRHWSVEVFELPKRDENERKDLRGRELFDILCHQF
jgi:hypothetical protein